MNDHDEQSGSPTSAAGEADGGPGSRVVLIGASNLTRCISTVAGLAGRIAPGPVEWFIAYGHGRSYGVRSTVFFRALPGVLECGLWDDLARRAGEQPAPMYALVTDIGNDILYGYDAPTLVDWVTRTIDRLAAYEARLVVTGLPGFNVDRLSPLAFRFFRRLFCPTSTLTLEQAKQRTHDVNAALRALAGERRLTLVEPEPAWYGLDPIHIRRGRFAQAWRTMLAPWCEGGEPPGVKPSPRRWLTLRNTRPQHLWRFGKEQRHEQPAGRWRDGEAVWMY